MKDKTLLYVILGIAAIFAFVVIYGLSAKKVTQTTPGGTSTTTGGIGDLFDFNLGSIFGGLFGGGKDKDKGNKYCDCSRPGYTSDGVRDSVCNEDRIAFSNDCG